jgi:rubrerythrin
MSEQDSPIEQILRQAIRFEENAYEFYTGAVEIAERSNIRQVLLDMAAEEVKHKDRLQALLDGNATRIISVRNRGQIDDLKLAEYLVPRELAADATLQDVLIVAMHREKSSNEFYATMASIADDDAAKSLFEFLAKEELVHKNKVETLYDEMVYQEN